MQLKQKNAYWNKKSYWDFRKQSLFKLNTMKCYQAYLVITGVTLLLTVNRIRIWWTWALGRRSTHKGVISRNINHYNLIRKHNNELTADHRFFRNVWDPGLKKNFRLLFTLHTKQWLKQSKGSAPSLWQDQQHAATQTVRQTDKSAVPLWQDVSAGSGFTDYPKSAFICFPARFMYLFPTRAPRSAETEIRAQRDALISIRI